MRKKSYITFSAITTIIAIILISGCTKPRPYGGDYDIHVLADSSIWSETEKTIRAIFEKTEPTPQPEKLFTIIKQEPKNYKRFKNLLFISTLDAKDQLSQAINSSLTENARAKVEQGEIMFSKEDMWAQNQKILFLIGNDLTSLINKIKDRQEDIFFQFENHWREFHKKILYSMNEQINVEKQLLKNFGWMIRAPIDYKLELQSSKDRFVMFHRKVPLRWISIFWEEASDPNVITTPYCIQKRNSLLDTLYKRIYIDRKIDDGEMIDQRWEPVITEEVNFLDRRALKLKGLWIYKKRTGGGPFHLYCFFDEPTERIYFIDMHMFAPDLKKSKIHYLRQMDIIAHTFKTNLEIKPEDL